MFNSSIEHPLPLHHAATYKNYESQSMSQAMKAVIEGGLSIRLAAENLISPELLLKIASVAGYCLEVSVGLLSSSLTMKNQNWRDSSSIVLL